MGNKIIDLHKEGKFMEEGAEGEITSILSGMSALGYKNDELTEVFYECLVGTNF